MCKVIWKGFRRNKRNAENAEIAEIGKMGYCPRIASAPSAFSAFPMRHNRGPRTYFFSAVFATGAT